MQRVLDLQWECFPPADSAREGLDSFGNRVLELRHKVIASEFRFEMTLRTTREHMSSVRAENLPPTDIGAYLLPSALCDRGLAILEAVRQIKTEKTLGRDKAQLSRQLCRWAHRAIKYSVEGTDLARTASQSLERGRGVCQDYSHLMIALCRACGLPARYVSGYNPGEGAMHAWVETLCGESWLSFDPTHDRPTRTDCVFVACGRDYRDVPPMSGAFHGKASATLETSSQTVYER